MTWNKKNVNESSNNWGGPWTEKKLEAFSKYVVSYLNIMKKHPFWETIYFDGFVGSGSRAEEVKSELFKQLKITEEEERVYKGSAERVLSLKNDSKFNYYYFIDKNEDSIQKLEEKFGNTIDKNIVFRKGDANIQIIELAKALKTRKYAALILLDPFGMQIDWKSIEELKGTRSDVWILVPTGVVVNRLLDREGKLKFSQKLESFFGLTIDEIKSYFYSSVKRQTLFGEEENFVKVSQPIEKIVKLYGEKMRTIWSHVTNEPMILKNRNGVPLFHFVFASNNKNAIKIAKQIIIKT